MAGQANGGQVVPPKGVSSGDMGRYVGNPNHIAQREALKNPNHPMNVRPTYARPPSELMNPNSPTYKPGLEEQWLGRNQGGVPNTREGFGKDGRPFPATPEYMKGFNPSGQQTMDSRMYTLDGKQMTGGSSYIAALTKHLESIGQGDLLKGGTYTPTAQPPATIAPPAPGMIPPPATIAPPAPGVQPPQPANINTLAAEGIKAAGAATGQGLSFNPQQVSVAGNSSAVNPNMVTGSNVVNSNVVGSNVNPALNAVTGSNVDSSLNAVTGSNVNPSQYNVTGSNVNSSLNDVAGTNVTGSNIAAQQVGAQNASPQVMAERLANTDMAQYMNPYTDQVIRANETDVLRGANMGLDMLGAQAQASGGFGGSRHGVAMGEIGRGMTDTLARTSAGLRQAGYQNAQQAAGQDISNNFSSQMANQAGGQFDVSTNLQRQLANQGAGLQASQQNQQNQLQANLANQQNNLQARLANQQTGMQGQLSNQANALQAQGMNQGYGMQGALANQSNALQSQGMNQQYGMQGQLANQGNALQSQGMNQQYGMQGQLANQGNALQSALANQSAGMQSGLANQSNALQSAGMNQSYNMQGQLANQQAGMQDIQNRLQASMANQGAGLQGNQQRLGAASQLGNISNLGFNMGQTVNNNMASQGAMQQALQQAIYDNAQGKFGQFTGQPVNSLGYLNNALGVTPSVGSSTLTSQKGLFDYLTLAASMAGK